MKNINPQARNIVITIVTLLGLFFGYKVVTETAIVVTPTVEKTDSLKIDTTQTLIDTTNAE